MHPQQKAYCLCLASPFFFQRSRNSLLTLRSVSLFFILSRLSNFFFPFTRAISNFIFLPLLYTDIGTIVKLVCSFFVSSFISFCVSRSLRFRSGSKSAGAFFG